MPYFMIGTQRSGSNLLRVMLDQSPHLVAPHPPHFLERLTPLLPLYGCLEDNDNFATLIEDVCQLIETNPVSWKLGRIDRAALAQDCAEHSLVAIVFAAYDLLAKHNGAQEWICKSLANVHHLAEIERFGGKRAKFIHLHRDGRDVALSFRKAVVGEKSTYHIARQWQQEQQKALELGQRLPASQFITVSYASLVTSPEAELRRLCDFMEVPFVGEMLEFYKSNEAVSTSQAGKMWSNVSKPLMAQNLSRFLGETSPRNLAVFEAVAGDMLRRLGYPLFSGFDEENEKLKKLAVANASPEDMSKRRAQDQVMQQIRNRLSAVAHNVA